MKWLILHGYNQSKELLIKRRARKFLNMLSKNNDEYYIINAFHSFDQQRFYWWTNVNLLDVVNGINMNRKGLEESIEYITQEYKENECDGLIGFSQGANIICDLLKHISPKKVICICGFYHNLFDKNTIEQNNVDTLIINGIRDEYVMNEGFLSQNFPNKKVLNLDMKHQFPSIKSHISEIEKILY